ncbi:pyridoxine 5'-phosphate synthase [Candidatus Blochmannia ocreatus (nom. nud.)]|uniref:Pyridoxine 5'-phosphate synthase n=1 Tax=Candidatus Blochmannia ocreatus (nom. nud.) TaxID=251538 RepID=A0ABY4SSR5_9ENTR|nr:pyridoxine 5'-phosphate synthase [Candidatus Blochmannia ocreatus]URJ25019.1 pyridoxine 5'-phosphate synthase [Candidatus Blochmannia ocreatus]
MSDLLLGVNIDHIATLRNARGTQYPNPVYAAFIAEQAGADSITIHLREDSRHITHNDVKLLRQTIQTAMNLEITTTDSMVYAACELKPHYCCLVPENRQELTTEGGLNIINNTKKLKDIILKLTNSGIRVSLFIEPNEQQIEAAHEIGANCVEIHTGLYANATDKTMQNLELNRIKTSAQHAVKQGLRVNAGHGLNYYNVKPIARLPWIQELNIGHAIISKSVFCGLAQAIKDMKNLLKNSRRGQE